MKPFTASVSLVLTEVRLLTVRSVAPVKSHQVNDGTLGCPYTVSRQIAYVHTKYRFVRALATGSLDESFVNSTLELRSCRIIEECECEHKQTSMNLARSFAFMCVCLPVVKKRTTHAVPGAPLRHHTCRHPVPQTRDRSA